MRKYVDEEDCVVFSEHSKYPNKIVAMTRDGYVFLDAPKKYSKEHIFSIIEAMNMVYNIGFEDGRANND